MNGKRIVASLRKFLADVRAGKPVKQTIVRRMTVKGQTIYVQETFKAPFK